MTAPDDPNDTVVHVHPALKEAIDAAYKRGHADGWKAAEQAAGIDIPFDPEAFTGEIIKDLPF